MDGEDNVFIIGADGDDGDDASNNPYSSTKAVGGGRSAATADNNNNNNAMNYTEEGEEGGGDDGNEPQQQQQLPAEGLIPLCVQFRLRDGAGGGGSGAAMGPGGRGGPAVSAATFGYDIARLQQRPWNEPEEKLSDYFNYGFDEGSWRLYCQLQAKGEASLRAQADAVLQSLQSSAYRAAPMDGEGGARSHNSGTGAGINNSINNVMGSNPYLPDGGRFNRQGAYLNNNGNMSGMGGGRGFHGGAGGGGGVGRDLLKKTKLCHRFAEGKCVNGDNCSYAHGVDELRRPPPMASDGLRHNNHHQHGGGGGGHNAMGDGSSGLGSGLHSSPPLLQQQQQQQQQQHYYDGGDGGYYSGGGMPYQQQMPPPGMHKRPRTEY